jgi:hypothetical protein
MGLLMVCEEEKEMLGKEKRLECEDAGDEEGEDDIEVMDEDDSVASICVDEVFAGKDAAEAPSAPVRRHLKVRSVCEGLSHARTALPRKREPEEGN